MRVWVCEMWDGQRQEDGKRKQLVQLRIGSHRHFLHPLPSPPQQSDSKTKRLSSHFEGLLADREALIEQLATQESTLKHALEDKAQAERKLKEERQRLISVGV